MGFLDLFSKGTIETIEWPDLAATDLVWRYPTDRRKIRMGARLTVCESQVAIFVDEGRTADCFEPGRYRLSTRNLPILTGYRSWKYGYRAPFHAEVYFVNTRQFTGQPWSTVRPVTIRDGDRGERRIAANGEFAFKVADAETLLREILETSGIHEVSYILGRLRSFLLSGLGEAVESSGIAAEELEQRCAELGEHVEKRLRERLAPRGFELTQFMIEKLSVLEEESRTGTCSCGHELEHAVKYCPKCGRKMQALPH